MILLLFSHPMARQSSTIYCDDTLLAFVVSALRFLNLVCQAKSLTWNNSARITFIKIITIKANAIKIYIKNTHFITIKHYITRIFIKVWYILICIQISKKLFSHSTCNKPFGNKIWCWEKIINSFITHLLSLILIWNIS